MGAAPRGGIGRARAAGGGGGEGEEEPWVPTPGKQYNTEFGYSRKDVLLICGFFLAAGFGGFWWLEHSGLDAVEAGRYVQVAIVLLMTVGWLGSYLFRVKTKKMTYVQQLKDYEDAVMQKRLEEMSDDQIQQVLEEGPASPAPPGGED